MCLETLLGAPVCMAILSREVRLPFVVVAAPGKTLLWLFRIKPLRTLTLSAVDFAFDAKTLAKQPWTTVRKVPFYQRFQISVQVLHERLPPLH